MRGCGKWRRYQTLTTHTPQSSPHLFPSPLPAFSPFPSFPSIKSLILPFLSSPIHIFPLPFSLSSSSLSSLSPHPSYPCHLVTPKLPSSPHTILSPIPSTYLEYFPSYVFTFSIAKEKCLPFSILFFLPSFHFCQLYISFSIFFFCYFPLSFPLFCITFSTFFHIFLHSSHYLLSFISLIYFYFLHVV